MTHLKNHYMCHHQHLPLAQEMNLSLGFHYLDLGSGEDYQCHYKERQRYHILVECICSPVQQGQGHVKLKNVYLWLTLV